MAQNTQTMTAGNLTIKFSPMYPVSTWEAMKLGRSLRLARRALEGAIAVLRPIEATDKITRGSISEAVFYVLRYHFKLDPQSAVEAPRGAWQLAVARIANNLRQILLGLMGPLTIADAYATTLGKEMDREAAAFQKDPAAVAGPQQLHARMMEALQRGQTKAASIRGFVSLKKPFALALPDDRLDDYARDKMRWDPRAQQHVPSVDVQASQRGSIHINFPELLREEKQVSELRVARTIIHEASHKFCNTQDHAYADRPIYRTMPMAEAMWNADSYAYAAVSLYKGRCFFDDAQMARAVDEGLDTNA